MLYFAYGSNMDWGQMKARCPSTRFVGIAFLPDHRLAFTRKSVKRNCGVADAVVERGNAVWGAVYEIDDLDLGKLDLCEGYRPGREKNSYYRRECFVLLDGKAERPLTAFTYFGDPQPNPPPPNSAYRYLLLSGARHWRLPEAYIRQLEAIEVTD